MERHRSFRNLFGRSNAILSVIRLITAIIFSFSLILTSFSSANENRAAEERALSSGAEEAPEDEAAELKRFPVPVMPGDILPRAVFFHGEKLTAELGDTINIMNNLTMFPETASIRGLFFKSSSPSVATIDAEGIITARGKGECDITAVTENGREASFKLTVFAVDVKSINISSPPGMHYAFESFTVSTDISPSDASVTSLTWTSSDESIAKVDRKGGVVCGLPGVAKITARAYGGETSSFILTVREKEAKAVKIYPETHTGRKGERFTLNAEILPADATYKDVSYSSSNPSVAAVSEDGTVLFRGRGKATITAEASNGVFAEYEAVCSKTFQSVHFRQGDPRWKFPREVAKKACLITAFAILLKNSGIDATPRTAYNAGGTGMNLNRLAEKFPFVSVCAVDRNADYFKSYSNGRTYIKNPGKNAVRAIKDALDRNPEGVIAYFSRGSAAHGVVAIGYIDNTVYYSDPGRDKSKGFDVPLSGTWVNAGHGMGYSDLAYIVAIDAKT